MTQSPEIVKSSSGHAVLDLHDYTHLLTIKDVLFFVYLNGLGAFYNKNSFPVLIINQINQL